MARWAGSRCRWRWPVVAGLVAACARGAAPAGPQPTDSSSADSAAVLALVSADSLVPTDTVMDPDRLSVLDSAPGGGAVVGPLPAPAGPLSPRLVRVCAGGDVMLGNNLDTLWTLGAGRRLGRWVDPSPDPRWLLAPLRPLLDDADIVLLNIEGAIGEGVVPGKCREGSRNCYAFRQRIDAGAALRGVARGAQLVGNLANNHAMDAGEEGFRMTQHHLRAAGAHVTGADTLATVVVTSLGDTVAFLGFSTAQAGPDPRDIEAVSRHISRAAGRYGRVVVTMHMGAEGASAQRTPDSAEVFLGEDRGNVVAFGRAAVEAGATAVFGHGPHVLRGAEWRGGSLIMYSLGNLLTYGPFNLDEPRNWGAVACVSLDRDGRVVDAVLRSTRQVRPGILSADPTGRAAWLVDSLSQLDFPESAALLMGEAKIERSDADPGG